MNNAPEFHAHRSASISHGANATADSQRRLQQTQLVARQMKQMAEGEKIIIVPDFHGSHPALRKFLERANDRSTISSAEELIDLIHEGYRDYMHHQADSKSSGAQE